MSGRLATSILVYKNAKVLAFEWNSNNGDHKSVVVGLPLSIIVPSPGTESLLT